MFPGKKILVLISCTKSKLNKTAKASEMYQGDVFKKSKKWSEINNFDYQIISAKYGLIIPDLVIEPYDLRLDSKKAVEAVLPKVSPRLTKMLTNNQYDMIICILGNYYMQAVMPALEKFPDIPISRMISLNGFFDYKKNIIKAINGDYSVFAQLRKKK